MGTAVAERDSERPGLSDTFLDDAGRPGILETIAILILCVVLLFGLAALDDRAQRRETARTQVVLADRAERAGERSSREAMTAPLATPARTDRLGRENSPIVIPAGPAWGPATSVVSHTQRSEPAPQTSLTDHARRDGIGPVLLLLMAGAGLSMAGAGVNVLSRRSA